MMRSVTWAMMAIGAITPMVRQAQYDPYPARHCEPPFHLQPFPDNDCVHDGYEQHGRGAYYVWAEAGATAAQGVARHTVPDHGATPPTRQGQALAAASKAETAAQRDTKAARNGGGKADIDQAVAALDQARSMLLQAEQAR